jgi:type IV secretory pathway VirB4 component
MNVETIVEEVKQEVVKVAEEVKAEVVKAVQELSAEEKLGIREIENEYLKAQIEINRLSQITQKAQKSFTDTVESLTKKYAVDPANWLFDNVSLTFKRK